MASDRQREARVTTRNFDALFQPRSIVLVGASNRPGSVGAVIARNLVEAGFPGDISFVNPHAPHIAGRASVHELGALTHAPDLAVIATPAPSVYSLLCELGDRGCRAAIVISAGDARFRAQVLEAAQPVSMRILGPNGLGFLSPAAGINASFAQLTPKPGRLALVTQSGAIATTLLDWAHGRGIGFSHVLSLGDMLDVDFGDVLDYLALDPATDAILLYIEQITHARKFLSAARIASRAKPVIAVKAGRSAGGAQAAKSHTGALAGADNVYDAAFRRAGMLRVDTLSDLFDAAESLASGLRPAGDRLMILTNGGGLGVLATDCLEQAGGRLAQLSAGAKHALDAALPGSWSHNNPIDILGDAHGDRYAAALDILTREECDAILVMNCPTGVADNSECARAVAQRVATGPSLLACWMGEASLAAPRAVFDEAHIPLFDTPEDSVRAFMQLAAFTRNQRSLLETPAQRIERSESAIASARTIIAKALAEKRALLDQAECKALIEAYGIPVAATRLAPDPEAAQKEAEALGGAVALKIHSPDITHKSDAGGVVLNLAPAEVGAAARAMSAKIAAQLPAARLAGFAIEPMIQRPHARELIIGASVDPTFGPVILFGAGGVSVEVVADTAIGLPPLNSTLARELVARTRVARLLAAYRDRSAADLDAITRVLVAVSDLIIDHPEIAELDINPLLADEAGVIAVDARMAVRVPARTDRMAIAPYPRGLSHDITLPDGMVLRSRPLRPDDAAALLELGRRTGTHDIRLRFHGVVRVDDALGAARLSQLDYDREMAFGAFDQAHTLAGVARLHFDPQIENGEFAVLVRTDMQQRGLGRALLQDVLRYARERGAKHIYGDILSENTAMLALARSLGAELRSHDKGGHQATFVLAGVS